MRGPAVQGAEGGRGAPTMRRTPLRAGWCAARSGTLQRDVAAARRFTAQRIKAGRKHGTCASEIGMIHLTDVSDRVPVTIALRQGRWRPRGEEIEQPVLEEGGGTGRQAGGGALLAELHQHARKARSGHRQSAQAHYGEATRLNQGRRFCREASLSATIQKWQASRAKTKTRCPFVRASEATMCGKSFTQKRLRGSRTLPSRGAMCRDLTNILQKQHADHRAMCALLSCPQSLLLNRWRN
jgi:hypothetical protein